MVVRVIIVLTNHKDGGPGWKTGWYLPEAAHPYHVFKQNGYQVTFASPLGGDAPMILAVAGHKTRPLAVASHRIYCVGFLDLILSMNFNLKICPSLTGFKASMPGRCNWE
ncbi:predicted protein, partial [Nematostella vectensis]